MVKVLRSVTSLYCSILFNRPIDISVKHGKISHPSGITHLCNARLHRVHNGSHNMRCKCMVTWLNYLVNHLIRVRPRDLTAGVTITSPKYTQYTLNSTQVMYSYSLTWPLCSGLNHFHVLQAFFVSERELRLCLRVVTMVINRQREFNLTPLDCHL